MAEQSKQDYRRVSAYTLRVRHCKVTTDTLTIVKCILAHTKWILISDQTLTMFPQKFWPTIDLYIPEYLLHLSRHLAYVGYNQLAITSYDLAQLCTQPCGFDLELATSLTCTYTCAKYIHVHVHVGDLRIRSYSLN